MNLNIYTYPLYLDTPFGNYVRFRQFHPFRSHFGSSQAYNSFFMSVEDNEFDFGVADTANVDRDSGDDFDIGGQLHPTKRPRRAKRPLDLTSTGLYLIFLCCDATRQCEARALLDTWAHGSSDDSLIGEGFVGILGCVLCHWRLRKYDEEVIDEHSAALQNVANNHHRRAQILAYLEYTAHRVFTFDEGYKYHCSQEFMEDLRVNQPLAMDVLGDKTLDGKTIKTITEEYSVAKPVSGFIFSREHAENLIKGDSNILEVMALFERMNKSVFLQRFPSQAHVRKYLATLAKPSPPPDDGNGNSTTDALYRLPGGVRNDTKPISKFWGKLQTYDAVSVLRYIKFADHIKDLAETSLALSDAIDFVADGDDERSADLQAAAPKKPRRTMLQRSRLRLDATNMLTTQREIAHIYENEPESLQSCHVYSDASPVTGSEIQGQLLEFIFQSGLVWLLILPGVCMHYGANAVLNKCVAFLWALHLVAGLRENILRWILNKVTSVTTDMGIEFLINLCADILPTFIQWRLGTSLYRLRNTVDRASRLLPFSLRIPGWSHLMSNLMKFATRCIESWPQIIECIRALVSFFKKEGWRKVVIRLVVRVYPEATSLLKHFTASLQKLRSRQSSSS